MSGCSVKNYPTRVQALDAIVKSLVKALESALQKQNRITFGVCGGRSAEALFPLLAASALPWASIDVLLVDERWVSTQSLESNEKLVRDSLLQGHASATTLVGLKTNHDRAVDALDAVEQRLDKVELPIDALLISMGDDGHIASLFPSGVENSENDRRVVATTSPRPPHERISLSPWVLRNSQRIILPVFGEGKQALFNQAIQQGPNTDYPVRHVLTQTDARCEVFFAP